MRISLKPIRRFIKRRLVRGPRDAADYWLKTRVRHEPYFGPVLAAGQTNAARMRIARRLVERESGRRPGDPLKILEVGSWSGGSAITFAEALRDHHAGRGVVVCVDPWEPYLDTSVNTNAMHRRMQRAARKQSILNLFLHNIRSAGCADLIVPIKSRSDLAFPLLAPASFDIVYIDGDHAYASVLHDIRGASKLVAEGGIVCGDDLELQSFECAAQEREAPGTDYLRDPKTGQNYHPGVTRAVGEFFGTVSVEDGFWAMRRSGEGWESVELS